jgi:hypothetical protein
VRTIAKVGEVGEQQGCEWGGGEGLRRDFWGFSVCV